MTTEALEVRKEPTRSVLQAVLRRLLPKDERFYDLLEMQALNAQRATAKLAELPTGDLQEIVTAVQDLEHAGDTVVRNLEEALASTFFTPLDREDLQALSSKLDDVLDYANSAARSCWMRGVHRPTAAMVELIRVLGLMTDLLLRAVEQLRRHDFAGVTALSRKVRELESEGDRYYRDAIYALYHDASVDAVRLLREEKVLGDLEGALNVAEDVADQLTYLAVKHG